MCCVWHPLWGCDRTTSTAICYTTRLPIFDSFHNKLKSNPKYLSHKVNRRCDDLIHILLKFEEDMFHERKHREIMMPMEVASLKLEGMWQQRYYNQINLDWKHCDWSKCALLCWYEAEKMQFSLFSHIRVWNWQSPGRPGDLKYQLVTYFSVSGAIPGDHVRYNLNWLWANWA